MDKAGLLALFRPIFVALIIWKNERKSRARQFSQARLEKSPSDLLTKGAIFTTQ